MTRELAQVSFVGHLAGVLVGYLYLLGTLLAGWLPACLPAIAFMVE